MQYRETNKYRLQCALVNIILYIPFIVGLLKLINPGFRVLYYTIDFCILLLLVSSVSRFFPVIRFRTKNEKHIVIFMFIYFMYVTLFSIINYQSVFYYIWGIRNVFRFFVYFIMCIIYLDSDTIKRNLMLMDYLFYINFFFVLFQYFKLGYRQDYLGGIFGFGTDSGAFLNVLCIIVVIKTVILFLYKKEKIYAAASKIAMSLIIAVLSETKYFFAEFAIIVLIALVMSKRFSIRKILISVFAVIGVFVAANYLVKIYPQWATFFSLEGVLTYISGKQGYTGLGDINRLSFISDCNRYWLKTAYQKFFGLGLGNCDYSEGLSIFSTPFYRNYGNMHYRWFTSSMTYLEQGAMGLTVYLCFYVMIIIKSLKIKCDEKIKIFSVELTIMAALLVFLGSSMRFESGYIMFYFMAIPFLLRREGLNDSVIEGGNV